MRAKGQITLAKDERATAKTDPRLIGNFHMARPGHQAGLFFVGPVSICRKRDGLNRPQERLNKTVVRPSLRSRPRSNPMKKYLVAAVLIVSFAAPAFAETFYVAFDPASHKCSMMHSQPAAPMKSMGSFKTEAEAKAAMGKMKECTA